MPVFYVLLIFGACLLWFASSEWFKVFGKIGYALWRDVKDATTDKNAKEKQNERE